jgi:hypothetical protein
MLGDPVVVERRVGSPAGRRKWVVAFFFTLGFGVFSMAQLWPLIDSHFSIRCAIFLCSCHEIWRIYGLD